MKPGETPVASRPRIIASASRPVVEAAISAAIVRLEDERVVAVFEPQAARPRRGERPVEVVPEQEVDFLARLDTRAEGPAGDALPPLRAEVGRGVVGEAPGQPGAPIVGRAQLQAAARTAPEKRAPHHSTVNAVKR